MVVGVFYQLLRQKQTNKNAQNKNHWFWQSPMDKSTFVEVLESSRKVHHNVGAETSKCRRIERIKCSSFTLPVSHFHQVTQLSGKRDFLDPWFCSQKKSESMWVRDQLPHLRHCQKDPFISWPNQKTEVCFTTEGQGVALGGHQRDMYPINHFMDFINRYAHALLGIPNLQRPRNGPWAPPIFHMPQPHTHSPHG